MKTNTYLDSRLQNRTAQLGGDELPKIDFAKRTENRGLPTDSLLKLIRREAPQFWDMAEVVGKWVWIQFEQKQPRQITTALAQLASFICDEIKGDLQNRPAVNAQKSTQASESKH